jgi:hypothetical protein
MTLMTGEWQGEAIGAEQFGKALSERLSGLRSALRQLLTELGSPRTPTLLRRQLGVGYTICWQVFQVVRSGDDESAGTQNAPSLGALKRLVVAAQEKGLTPDTADVVRAAADDFHQFIREHAEDRDYFDSMVAGTTRSQNSQSVLVQRRRAAYRANSHVWGSQNDLWGVAALVRRSAEDPTKMDTVVLSRQQGLRRLRADATAYLMAMKVDLANRNTPSGQDDLLRNALDPDAAAATGMPLIPEFSTDPLPQVRCKTTNTGRRLFNWIDDAVGLKSSCDIVTGTFNRSVPMVVEADGQRQVVFTSAVRNKASALLVLDLIVHRASFPGVRVQSMVHEALAEVCTLEEAQAGHQFTVEEGVAHLGRASAVNLAEFPQYRALLQHAAARAGWDLSEFDVYRLRVPYPIMGAVHRLFFFDPLQ